MRRMQCRDVSACDIFDVYHFLREFKLDHDADGLRKGHEVAIIGGGNTAVDVARTVLRLGALPTIYYRHTIKEMPAIPQEVKEALLRSDLFALGRQAVEPKQGYIELESGASVFCAGDMA